MLNESQIIEYREQIIKEIKEENYKSTLLILEGKKRAIEFILFEKET